ncbi:MAG: ABC transporter ATP-binding protein [Trueperaceae bacterium]|nr:ABC transporter ATP-binding protein [Trueperaceae bacterium]
MGELLRLNNVGLKYERRQGRWRFHQFWVLKDISFSLSQGDVLGVVGRNGAGKSTLLRLLAGIYKPNCGSLERMSRFSSSLIALNVGLAPRLSGRDNVILGALLLGLDRDKATSIVEAVKDYSELGDFFEQPVTTYSTGMKSRLGFAIAYYANPDLILIDEAIGGVGDKTFVNKSKKAIEEKIMRGSSTVVLVSHSVGTLKEFCNRVIWIEDGVVHMDGDPKTVLSAYADAA